METKYSVIEGDFNQVVQTCRDFSGARANNNSQTISSVDQNQLELNFYPYTSRPFNIRNIRENGFALVDAITSFEDKACVSFLYKNSLSNELCSFCLIYSKKNPNNFVGCHIRNPQTSSENQSVHIFSPVSYGVLPQLTPEKNFQVLCTTLLPEASREKARLNKLMIALSDRGLGDPMCVFGAIEMQKYTPEWILSAIIDRSTGAVKHGKELNAFKAKINPNYERAVTAVATHWSYRYFSPAPNLPPVRINPAICLTSVALAAGFLATGNLTLPLALALSLIFLLSLAKTYATFQANEEHLEHVLSL